MAASWEDYSFGAAKQLRLDTFVSEGRSFLDLDEPVSPLLSPPASPRAHDCTAPISATIDDQVIIESPLPRQAHKSYFAQYSTQNRISKQYTSRCDRQSPVHSPRSGTPVARTGFSPTSSPKSSRPSSPFAFGESMALSESLTNYQTYSASSIRVQRQRALRAQCSSAHLKEISALVARMVQTGDQCNVASPPENTRPASEAAYPSPRSETDEPDDDMVGAEKPKGNAPSTPSDEGFVEGRISIDEEEDDDLAEATMRLRLQYRRSVEWGSWNQGAGERACTPPEVDSERRRSSGFTKNVARVRKYSSPTVRRR